MLVQTCGVGVKFAPTPQLYRERLKGRSLLGRVDFLSFFNLLRRHWLMTLYKFRAHNIIIRYLCIHRMLTNLTSGFQTVLSGARGLTRRPAFGIQKQQGSTAPAESPNGVRPHTPSRGSRRHAGVSGPRPSTGFAPSGGRGRHSRNGRRTESPSPSGQKAWSRIGWSGDSRV